MSAAKKKHWTRPKGTRRTIQSIGRKTVAAQVLEQWGTRSRPGPRHGKPLSIAVHLGWNASTIEEILEEHGLWRREREREQGGCW